MQPRYIEDFDLVIDDVVLAQAGNMRHGSIYRGYEAGRQVCGLVGALSGRCAYLQRVGQQSCLRRLEAGEIAFLPSSIPYIVRNDEPADFNHYTINFTVSRQSGAIAASQLLEQMQVLRPRNLPAFERLFRQLVEIWNLKRPGFRMRSRSILYELLTAFFWEKMQLEVDADAYQKTLPACQYIDDRFMEPITLSQLAQECALSPTHFRRLFRAVYNVAPIDYLLDLRIRKAEDLLLSSHYTVQEVARLTGFQDASYFCRFFRQQIGLSPRQYREARL